LPEQYNYDFLIMASLVMRDEGMKRMEKACESLKEV
jgi:hypothetical protein